jgi:guanylate kinase
MNWKRSKNRFSIYSDMPGKGKLVIFSAPSGSGKTTLVKHVMHEFDDLSFSVSACSRPRRRGEKDGRDYYFMDEDLFREKIDRGEFVEWEEVYPGHYYGTLYSEVERIRDNRQNIVFDVDVKGGLNIKRIFGDEALAIFVKPPSVKALEKRLYARDTEPVEKIRMRIAKAEEELAYESLFDVTIVNDNLEKAKKEAREVVDNFIHPS